MTKEKDWHVTHHYLNPRREIEEFFSRRSDAVRAVVAMELTDFEDEQYSTIENVRTGLKGSKRWGHRRITWTPPKNPTPLPPARDKGDGRTQLAFQVSGLPEPDPWPDPARVITPEVRP